jgi:site-specific DNA recombinase
MNLSKLIAIYARVSTARQEEEQTIQTQISVLNEFAKKNNYTIVESYLDEGWSGDSIIRPSLDKLRQDVKKKKWEAVLIYDPDRLARRYSYQELIMDELRDAGIEVIFVTISTPKNSEDKILHGVRGLFAEYERAKIAERFRLGKLRKVQEGHILLSEPLYGYSYIPKQDKQHGYYEINENEANVIKMIFSWIDNEQLTLRGVVRRLQEKAIRPRKSKRGVWSTSTLSTLLKNRTYIGEAHWGSTYSIVPQNPRNKEIYRKIKKSSRKLKPVEEWVTIPVPAIIERATFERVRNQIESNFELSRRNTKNEYLLSGKIWCRCGKRRVGEGPQKGKYLYYRCCNRVNNFPLPATCNIRGINAKIADELVWKKIVNLMSSPELMMAQVSSWLKNKSNLIQTPLFDEEKILTEISQLKNKEDRYNQAYANELLSIDQLKEYLKPLREKVLELESILNSKQKIQNDDIILPNESEIQSFSEKAIELINEIDFGTKRNIIKYVIDRVIGTPERLKVCGYLPLNLNENVALFTSHRDSVDTISKNSTLIPFYFTINLPTPNYVT